MDAFRELERGRHHGVLPGNLVLVHGRVVVIIPFPQDFIVHRMVQHFHAHFLQQLVLVFVRRQEADIDVAWLDVCPSGLGRINRGQGLGHVVYRVRIVQFVPQDNHVMIDFRIPFFFLARKVGAAIFGARPRHYRKQQPQPDVLHPFHSKNFSWQRYRGLSV